MSSPLAVLVVIAHPDDETLFAGFIHALSHQIKATVDLVCITNGEGGFRYSAPSACLYDNLQLAEESVGRQHLPRIHLKYDRNVEIVFKEQWNTELVIEQLEQTIRTGNGSAGYDIMLIMLPNVDAHGHHSASGLLALETIERLQQNRSTDMKIPTVLGGSEFTVNQVPTYAPNRLAEISPNIPNQFRFNRTWKLSGSNAISDYHMIVLWTCSEHKSQGSILAEALTIYARENEQYFYLSINNHSDEQMRIQFIQKLFNQLTDIHRYDGTDVL